MPARQLSQLDDDDEPSEVENEPAEHETQALPPRSGWKLPAPHSAQLNDVVAPVVERYDPASQPEHLVAPVTSE